MAMNKQRRTSNISNIFSYDDAGNIVLKDYGQVTRYSWNGLIHGFIGSVSVSSVAAATTDTDRFLVSDGGVLKYRTGSEMLSDIGAQAAGSYVPTTRTLTINGTTYDLTANRSWTITAGVTGSGTTNFIPKWTSSTNLGNSIIDDDGVSASVSLSTNGSLNIKYLSAIKLAFTGRTTFGAIDLPVGIDFVVRPDSVEKLKLSSTGALKLASYGTGAVAGTSAYSLAVDATGNVIEVPGVTGTGTANYLPKFTGTGVLGNSVVYDNGTNIMIGSIIDDGYKFQVQGGSVYTKSAGFVSNLDNGISQALYATGQLLTGSASNGMIYLDATWNTTGNPSAIYLNVTNTASGPFSKLLDLRVGINAMFQIDKTGGILTGQPIGGTQGIWKLGQYNATAPSATGYVHVEINGVLYKLLAST